jgi:peroxiredoxin
VSCVAELVQLAKQRDALAAAGIRVVTLTAGSAADIRTAAGRFDLPFAFIADDGALMDELDLRHRGAGPRGSDVFFATTFLLDRDGVVRWKNAATDIRDRTPVARLLAVAAEIKSASTLPNGPAER